MKKTILLAMAFVVASFGLGHLWVEAAPPRPASFYGTVTLNGANVPLPASVEGLIDGVAYAASPVMESGGATVYALDVPGDIPERVGKQGGQAGETIQFRVAGLPCAQTATWTEGVHLNLNLSATGTLPTNTPSPTLSATPTSTITPTPSQTPEVTPTPAIVQLPPDKDTFISEWEPNTNYATDQRLKVRASPYRSLLHFDTSSIPMNSTVSSAELYLYLDWYTYQASQTPNVSAYKVLTDWAEAQATWVMRSSGIGWGSTGCSGTADRDPTAKAFTTMGEPSTWYSWDISGLVQDWVWSPGDNRGLLLVSDGGRELRFHSQNAPNYKPYLRVEYISGTGPGPTPTLTATPDTTPSTEPTVHYEEFRNASQDTYIYVSEPSEAHENHGLRVTGQGFKQSLLDFDINSLPAEAEIVSATLRLTASTYDDGRTDRSIDVGAYRVNRRWVANQATWNLARTDEPWGSPGCASVPGDREALPASITAVSEVSISTLPWERKLYDWDVTAIVQAWLDSPSGKAGLVLASESATFRDIGFMDSAYLGQEGRDLHPVLFVWWRERLVTPTATATASATPTATATPNTGTVSGTVFNDLNGNGSREGGELGILNISVRLQQGAIVLREVYTNGDGHYSFANVLAGDYAIVAVPGPGYMATTPNPRSISLSGQQTLTVNVGLAEATAEGLLGIPLIMHNLVN